MDGEGEGIQRTLTAEERTIFQTLRPNARDLIQLLTCCKYVQLPVDSEIDVRDLTRSIPELLDPHDVCPRLSKETSELAALTREFDQDVQRIAESNVNYCLSSSQKMSFPWMNSAYR